MFRAIVILLLTIPMATQTLAQQVTVAAPFRGISDGFHEYYGFGFNFRHRWSNGMMFFDSGGNGMNAIPFFGGFDPGSASTFGLNGGNGNTSWGLNFVASQGSTRSNVTTTPTLTLQNGGFGFLNNTTQRPFVTGFVPVVGQNLEQERIVREQLFESAAAEYLAERIERNRIEEQELDAARRQSKQRLASREPKKDDPPLVLRGGSPSYSRAQ